GGVTGGSTRTIEESAELGDLLEKIFMPGVPSAGTSSIERVGETVENIFSLTDYVHDRMSGSDDPRGHGQSRSTTSGTSSAGPGGDGEPWSGFGSGNSNTANEAGQSTLDSQDPSPENEQESQPEADPVEFLSPPFQESIPIGFIDIGPGDSLDDGDNSGGDDNGGNDDGGNDDGGGDDGGDD